MKTDPNGLFRDVWNPTDEEIVRWAYLDASQPEEDWDLCVAERSRADLCLRLAADGECPKRRVFLSCLYLLVGDVVRTKGRDWSFEDAAKWLARQPSGLPEEVVTFFERGRELLAKPELFDYEKWCGGGYALGK